MRTLAQKQKPKQKAKTVSSSIHSRAWSSQSQAVRSILHLQRTIGNQGVQRLLQANAKKLEAGSNATVSSGFSHDFSRIPIFSSSSVQTQPKLLVNTPGDVHEQEADRAAERVMRMPEPYLKHTFAWGGGCPKCELEQQGQEIRFVQRGHISANNVQETEATRIVNEVVNSPGEPLDSATTAFFEPRFRHDFSQVRVHTDTQSAKSAQVLNARAFTIGRDVVFAPGEYGPQDRGGRQLLAHELAHVVQQSDVCQQIRPNVDLVAQRAPKNPPKGRKTRELIDTGIALVIDNVLSQSTFLKPYIKDKLKTGRKITGNLEVVPRGRYKDLYIKYAKKRGAKESEAKKNEPNRPGFYDPDKDRIFMRAGSARVGGALHEAIHFFAEPEFRSFFLGPVDEGVTQFYTNFVLAEFGLKDSPAYPEEYLNALSLVSIVGREALGKAYFMPGYARKLYNALTRMYLEEHKMEWFMNISNKDFVALSAIRHRPLPEDWAISIHVYRPPEYKGPGLDMCPIEKPTLKSCPPL